MERRLSPLHGSTQCCRECNPSKLPDHPQLLHWQDTGWPSTFSKLRSSLTFAEVTGPAALAALEKQHMHVSFGSLVHVFLLGASSHAPRLSKRPCQAHTENRPGPSEIDSRKKPHATGAFFLFTIAVFPYAKREDSARDTQHADAKKEISCGLPTP